MQRLFLALILLSVLQVPARADYDSGLDAFMRQDYRAAYRELEAPARQGNVDAQYLLGNLYASGRGVPQDYVQAHLWYNLAAAGGKSKAVRARDEVARAMTPRQVAKAQRLARDWRPRSQTSSGASATTTSGATATTALSGRALVAETQRSLTALGYDPGPSDGLMGWKTRAAIRSYQSQAGLPVNGEPSRALLARLRGKISKSSSAGAQPTATGATTPTGPALITEVQHSLGRLGYEPGPVDGKMAWKTRSAIRSYQSQAGLTVDGEATPALLAHLRSALERRRPRSSETAKGQSPAIGTGGVSTDRSSELTARLKRLIDRDEQRGLADPTFLSELRRALRRHAPPRRRRLVSDDFSDGEFMHRPTWVVAGGRFAVSPGGELVSDETASQAERPRQGRVKPEDLAAAVLSQVLGAKSPNRRSSPKPSGEAEIFLAQKIPNAFTMTAELSLRPHSICELGVYVGEGRETGYRVNLVADGRLSLERRDRGGVSALMSNRGVLGVGDDRVHKLVWRRRGDGRMVVSFDEAVLPSASDATFAGGFAGIVHVNKAGECRLGRISVDGAQ